VGRSCTGGRDLVRNSMPEALASLLEQLFEKFLEDTKDEKGKPADDE
jgi:hypothetical protein